MVVVKLPNGLSIDVMHVAHADFCMWFGAYLTLLRYRQLISFKRIELSLWRPDKDR